MSSRLQVRKLIELAVHSETPAHEAAAAAMAACKRIHKERLLDEEHEQEGSSVGFRGEAQAFEVAFLVLSESDVLFRLAKIIPPSLQSEKVILLPKEYVRDVLYMNRAEVRKIGWRGSRVIKRVTIAASYFQDARSNGWDDWH